MTDVPSFPFKLERLLFLRAIVVAVPGHVPSNENPPLRPVNTLDVSRDEDTPNQFNARMRSVANLEMDKRFPYMFDMECVALLIEDGSLPAEEAHRGATVSGHSVLYGAIRESVAWLTGRQPYGPMLLGFSVLQPQKASLASDPAKQ